MAVEWIGDTANSNLKIKYDEINTKIYDYKDLYGSKQCSDVLDDLNSIKSDIDDENYDDASSGCDSLKNDVSDAACSDTIASQIDTLKQMLDSSDNYTQDEIIEQYQVVKNTIYDTDCTLDFMKPLEDCKDSLTNTTLALLSKANDKILSIHNKLKVTDDDTKLSLLNNLKTLMHDILSGTPLDPIINNIQSTIDEYKDSTYNTDSEHNKLCTNISTAVQDIINAANENIAAISATIQSIDDVMDMDNLFAQKLAKAAALINCLDESLAKNQSLTSDIETTDSTMKNVATKICDDLNNNVSKGVMLNEAMLQISINIGAKQQYDSTNNTVQSIYFFS